jgi:hypothetical protein
MVAATARLVSLQRTAAAGVGGRRMKVVDHRFGRRGSLSFTSRMLARGWYSAVVPLHPRQGMSHLKERFSRSETIRPHSGHCQ